MAGFEVTTEAFAPAASSDADQKTYLNLALSKRL
jgi:hypothetical protein